MCVCTVPNHSGGPQRSIDADADTASESDLAESSARTRVMRPTPFLRSPPMQATRSAPAAELASQSARSP